MLGKYLKTFKELIKDIKVIRFRQEGANFELVAIIYLADDSELHIKEYLFRTGNRKYSYHWQDKNSNLIGRWDNAPHWPEIESYPDHFHSGKSVTDSKVKDIESVLNYIHKKLTNKSHDI